MLDRILTCGWYGRTPVIHERERTNPLTLNHLSPIDLAVELVQRDTSVPAGHIYEQIVYDEQTRLQYIRLVKVTRPYNLDFLTSAHVATFLLPHAGAQRIVTPLDGTETIWLKYLAINQQILDAVVQHYLDQSIGPFVVVFGVNFSPYTRDSEYLETQSVKVVHAHTYLLSESALSHYEPFVDACDFHFILRRYGHSASDIRQDFRRFFPTAILKTFAAILTPYLLSRVPTDISQWNLNNALSFPLSENYPLVGIEFNGEGSHILASVDTWHLMRALYSALDNFYKEFLMEAFTENYMDIIHSPVPQPTQLLFRPPTEITRKVLEFTDQLVHMCPEDRLRLQRLTDKLANRISVSKKDGFAFGPTSSFTWLYNPTSQRFRMFFTFTPFGGGSLEALGFDKISAVSLEEKQSMYLRYTSSDSRHIESELDQTLIRILTNSHFKQSFNFD